MTPTPSPRLRLALLGVGIGAFLWLGFEDNNTLTVAVLGTLIGVLTILGLIRQQPLSPRLRLLQCAVTGALMGGSAVVMTVLLMFFKTAWHSHAFPDYPVPVMLAMLARLPLWAIGGACIGTGWGLYRR